MEKVVSFNDAVITPVKENCYRTHFWYMSECEAMNLLKTVDLRGKVKHYN